MRRMGSQLLNAAEVARVAAGGALAVDRDAFSAEVTRRVEEVPQHHRAPGAGGAHRRKRAHSGGHRPPDRRALADEIGA